MTYIDVLSALSDPTRRSLFERLRAGPRSVGELARGASVSQPAVSQHLKVLRRAGLVRVRPDGTRRIYSLDRLGLDALRAYVETFWDGVLDAFADERTELPTGPAGTGGHASTPAGPQRPDRPSGTEQDS